MRKCGLQPRARYHAAMSQPRRDVADRPKPRMTYEEYLRDPEIDEHTEWVDGEVIQMAPAGRLHSALQSYTMRLLGLYLETKHLGELSAPGVFESTVLPRFRLRIDALWSLPPVPPVLCDMGVAL
jgi:hypothetical protein